MKTYTLTGEKQLPESELQIDAEISYETVAKHRVAALKKLGEHANVPGFRVGHVPEHILLEKVGELSILEEAGYNAIEETLPEILKEKRVSLIGDPRVTI
ncbi:MAG: trigger factor family protein, partial [Candidatus Taylorbacteria bacterium]|nr:trigger factor family protein [Candidatus Taylorbacteria bacterium]